MQQRAGDAQSLAHARRVAGKAPPAVALQTHAFQRQLRARRASASTQAL